jgi:hypothetical protein
MLMVPHHARALIKLNARYPITPTSFPRGYSDEAVAAIINYTERVGYHRYTHNISMTIERQSSMDALYRSMPFVARHISDFKNGGSSWADPSNAWTPGDANLQSFHHLDDRSGNWGNDNYNRLFNPSGIDWTARRTWGDFSSDDEGGDDDRDRRDY